MSPFSERRVKGYLLTPKAENVSPILVIRNTAKPPEGFERILRVRKDIETGTSPEQVLTGKWEECLGLAQIPDQPLDYLGRVNQVRESWYGSFTYSEEVPDDGIPGLRSPQIGAIHAVHAHWTVSEQPATIVMPTGTGKTETMLAVLVSKQCRRLLAIVPTDALRSQISSKFLTLGILKSVGVLSADALYPIVGILNSRPKTPDEVDSFFEKCNVVVTTMSVAGQCNEDVQKRMSYHCPFLFIDEAHHTAAPTWARLKKRFQNARILQFTATPYRNDDKPIGGKIIYNYPLKKAQEQGYFRPIHFKPVTEFDPSKSDLAIARLAVKQLRQDRERFNHILLARVGSVERAGQVFPIYEQFSDMNPVQIHSGIKSKTDREDIRRNIIRGESKIVVCVDMLGEGFDLPELKIAALHDIRKSLAITLQLAGRFTRARTDLGEPTFIANIADVDVRDELAKLYRQDSDWNTLLPRSSDMAIQEQVGLWEFIEGFGSPPDDLPLQNIRPAMSAVVYRTHCEEWSPENFRNGIPRIKSVERIYHDLNPQENALIVVTATKTPIKWAQLDDFFSWDWELLILLWNRDLNLLFVHSSSNRGHYRQLAEAVAGPVAPIQGASVFRCFSGINRLKLQNVGLIRQLGRLIRYTMRAGSDVEPGLSESQRRHAFKSNIFGMGYELGSKTSIGCSYKGRIWSRRVGNIESLARWCNHIGTKVIDDEIDPDEVLKGTLVPVTILSRPRKMPFFIDWPAEMYVDTETAYEFIVDGGVFFPLWSTDIELREPTEDGELGFTIRSDADSIDLSLHLFDRDGVADFRISVKDSQSTLVQRGAYQHRLEEFLYQYPPIIWFVDGSALEGNSLIELNREFDPYPVEKILSWNWEGTNIQNESQGVTKDAESIQHRVISELRKASYEVVFDDDASGEAADVVTINVKDDSINVEFYHCKFSGETFAGGRVDDLYVVCGQAQKSVHWNEKPTELFDHLLRRETKRIRQGATSRFEIGDMAKLLTIKQMSQTCPVNFGVFIVQPGLSKKKVSYDQLQLLSVTDNYLMETYQLPLVVIGSA